jgi:hypothetical protein
LSFVDGSEASCALLALSNIHDSSVSSGAPNRVLLRFAEEAGMPHVPAGATRSDIRFGPFCEAVHVVISLVSDYRRAAEIFLRMSTHDFNHEH